MNYLEHYLNRTVEENSCLVWQGCFNTDGYPRANYKGNANGKLHRIVYQLTRPDEDIDGKVIRHKCDNPQCINPDHLESGTVADNNHDRDSRERHTLAAFTAKQVKTIRSIYSTGEFKQSELAKLFNVDARTIQQIVRRTSYRWVQ